MCPSIDTSVDSESRASPSKLMEDAYDLEKSGTYLAESGLLPHLLTAMHQLTFAPEHDTAKHFGEHTKGRSAIRFSEYQHQCMTSL